MVSRDKRVTLKFTSTRKQRWADYAADEDTEWTDLSDLVRGAVEKEISGALDREAIKDLDLRFDTDQFDQTLNELLAEVTDELEAIQGELTTVKDLAELVDRIASNTGFPSPRRSDQEGVLWRLAPGSGVERT